MSRGRRPSRPRRARGIDPARRAAYDALRAVNAADGYANLVLGDLVTRRRLDERDAGFATELLNGTCRLRGTYDAILERAAGRPLASLQPAVVDVLRLGTHQLLSTRVPAHAAVTSSVDLVAAAVGERATGVVNAVLRRVVAHDLAAWVDLLAEGLDGVEEQAIRHHHPIWVAQAFTEVLGSVGARQVMEANNQPPDTTLAARPGLASLAELVAEGARPGAWSPYAAVISGNPAQLSAVREGRAGVQDEGSQLVAVALSRVAAPDGPWLDLCAGPGGKAALLTGLAAERAERLVAAERQPHRARLVAQALRGYAGYRSPDGADLSPLVVAADGTRPAWRPGTFARVVADVPCTGIGALRRRPDARWRRQESDLEQLVPLQEALLGSALDAAQPGGVVAYVTCSPHPAETEQVVRAVQERRADVTVLDAWSYLGEVDDLARGPFIQLWPHRHRTDAMFCALLRRGTPPAAPLE